MSSGTQSGNDLPGKQELEAMSVFRYELRKFLRVSEEIANAAGITTLQYQLLLHVRGFAGRRRSDVFSHQGGLQEPRRAGKFLFRTHLGTGDKLDVRVADPH